ncbi:M23 family peptidase, partial [Streptomyces hydrogenans]
MAERDPRNRTGRSPLRRGLVTAVLAVGMLTASTAPGYGTGTAGPASGPQFTPLTAAVMTEPTPFPATDGRTHLSYELLTTSALPSSTRVRLDRVEVRDARTHRVVGSLSGRALADAANPVGDP